jgi:cytochrome c oxidase subunit 2
MRSGKAPAARLALAVTVLISLGSTAVHGAQPRVVKISAKKFEFTPSEIHVRKGESIVLELTSQDRKHGFNLPAFKIRNDIVPKEVTRVTLTPTEAGTFEFHCDTFCGDGHEDMTGTLVVTE